MFNLIKFWLYLFFGVYWVQVEKINISPSFIHAFRKKYVSYSYGVWRIHSIITYVECQSILFIIWQLYNADH